MKKSSVTFAALAICGSTVLTALASSGVQALALPEPAKATSYSTCNFKPIVWNGSYQLSGKCQGKKSRSIKLKGSGFNILKMKGSVYGKKAKLDLNYDETFTGSFAGRSFTGGLSKSTDSMTTEIRFGKKTVYCRTRLTWGGAPGVTWSPFNNTWVSGRGRVGAKTQEWGLCAAIAAASAYKA